MYKVYVCLSSLLAISIVQGVPVRTGEKEKIKSCGYESCVPIKEGYVNIHLIPHSHDDVGWVKTVDQFYYGTNLEMYPAAVQFIYDNVLRSVQKNPNRKFIYVETAFFWKWWLEQGDFEKNLLKELVNNGQIEFIGGGWSMNDEAVTNYQSIIDQMSWGLRRLSDCFGECARPKMGWQIDPFGHSSEMASIFAQLGYDGVILGRIDFQDKEVRLANKSMEMVWRGSHSLGRPSDIFTSILFNHYDAPRGFCFDILCADNPLVDDVNSAEYNIAEKAEEFIAEHIRPMMQSFQTSNVIIPMGRDFAYQQAEAWFTSMDRLIKYVNIKQDFNGTKYHMMYSTPSCYTAAVHKESQGQLSSKLKTDDFLPYGSESMAYWTGYYTSRPTLKRFERIGNNFLQICKQLFTLGNIPQSEEPKLNSLREAMGVMQHHDAITGTEKEIVAYDYAKILYEGIENCGDVSTQALKKLTNSNKQFTSCLLANISECRISEKAETFVVTLYNPLSRPVSKVVRLPVLGESYSITDYNGETVKSELFPIPTGAKRIIGRNSNATLELVFIAKDVPPLGYKSFYIQNNHGDDIVAEDLSWFFSYSNNNGASFDVDPSTGLVNKIDTNGVSLNLNQTFWFYNGTNGWGHYGIRASGAYIFRPEPSDPIKLLSETARFEVYRGELVTEVHQTFNEYASQVIRVYETEQYVEFNWIIGPLEMEDLHGKEVITRYTTDLNNKKVFYTDSNGRETMKRVRDYRPTWDVEKIEREASNYYPVTSKISIRDEERNVGLTVLTERAEGGSSLHDGEIELMLLRNTMADDQLGVSEALIELAYTEPIMVRGSHYVVGAKLENNSETEPNLSTLEHKIADEKLLDSWVFLSVPDEITFNDYKQQHKMMFSGLKKALPDNVHIMTLEPWKDSTFLLRLEHTFEKNEDPTLSRPVQVNLQDLFTLFDIKKIQETTLGGNQLLKDNQRLMFNSPDQRELENDNHQDDELLEKYVVSLNPMQIRTFIISIEMRTNK
ncbi:lysosomal alpha-mannosidase-like [Rhynchophorus ferrugineus]|uniref:lysosomal alpha-mannosidase-like n=1 Tax=Rhynchophorus ferrugineus TaxID=354439 RepID=UPI003FCCD811